MFQSPSLRGSGRFRAPTTPSSTSSKSVSIPFIAGQWSLRVPARRKAGGKEKVSIPFIAGQWSLRTAEPCAPSRTWRFNPLHCGAVVASCFDFPRCLRPPCVSIPFIAGQWSLRASVPFPGAGQACFNPLHCGAVVASKIKLASNWDGSARFNPLHCGAVVASGRVQLRKELGFAFQSPSLRGSGRFGGVPGRPHVQKKVSIPFIAGQWSLRDVLSRGDLARSKFQSPSLRGSGRFLLKRPTRRTAGGRFNPLHCGAVVASIGRR